MAYRTQQAAAANRRPRGASLALCSQVVVAVLIFFSPFLLTGRVPFGGDVVMLNYPLLSMLHSTLAAGALPLWNPFSGGGAPLTPFSALVAYPPAWLTAVLPATPAIGWTYILDFGVAGVSMALLTRRLGAGTVGSLVGALCFTFSGYMIAHLYAGHFLEIGVIAWMPGLFYCAHSLLDTGRWRYAIAGGVCLGLQVLANGVEFLPFTLYPLLFVLAWRAVAAYRRAAPRQGAALVVRGVAALLCVGVLAGSLSAVLTLPFLQVLGRTLRSAGVPFADATHLSLPFYALSMLTMPNAYGNAADDSYWLAPGQHLYFHELYAFVGIIPLAAAVLAWSARRRAPATAVYSLLAVGGLVLALGHNTPLYQALYGVLPGLALIRVPSRWLLVTTFGVAVLAALGTEVIVAGVYRRGGPWPWLVGLVTAVFGLCVVPLVVMACVPGLVGGQTPPPGSGAMMAQAVVRLGVSLLLVCFLVLGRAHGALGARALALALVALTVADLWTANAPLVRYVDPAPYFVGDRGSEVSAWLHQYPGNYRVLAVDHSLPLRAGMIDPLIRDVQDFAPMTLREYWAYTHPQQARHMESVSVTQARAIITGYDGTVTRLLGVRYFITDRPLSSPTLRWLDWGAFRHWYVPHLTSWNGQRWRALTYVYRDVAALPMFYFASKVRLTRSDLEAARLTRRGDVDLYRVPLLDPLPAEPHWLDWPAVRGVQMLWSGWVAAHDRTLPTETVEHGWRVRYGQNAVTADGVAPKDGYLVLNDVYYPGWIVTVDGRQAPVQRMNYLLRGVRVGAGGHHVRFVYAPLSYLAGLIISAGAATALLLGSLIWLLWRLRIPVAEGRRRARARGDMVPAAVTAEGISRLRAWTPNRGPIRRAPVAPPPSSASGPRSTPVQAAARGREGVALAGPVGAQEG